MLARAGSRMLQRMGFDVVTVNNPLEALDAAHKAPVDVVVLDVNLPNFSGVELGHELRANGVDVPILFISGDPASLDDARAAGFPRMTAIAKPYTAEHLRSAVDLLLLA